MKKFTCGLLTAIVSMIFPFLTTAQQWNALDDQLNTEVYDLCVYNGELYAGGSFTYSAGNPCPNRLARYDGEQWHPIGADNIDGNILSVCVYNDKLYIGGEFSYVDGQYSRYIACWDGSAWEPLDWQLDWFVHEMFVYDGELYFTGPTYAGPVYLSELGKYDGENVTAASDDWFYDNIYAMEEMNGHLWAGGRFTQVGSLMTGRLAYWDGISWAVPQEGVDNIVYALGADKTNDILYIGGYFTMAGSVEASLIAGYDFTTQNYFALEGGVSGNMFSSVKALLSYNDKLFVGGEFWEVNNQPQSNFAIWDGQEWEETETNIGIINKFCVFQDEIYAGGYISGGVMRWGESSGLIENNITALPLTVFPNPANKNISIDLDKYPTVKFSSVTLINLVGEKIINQTENLEGKLNIDISSLPVGIYVITAQDNAGAKYIKKITVMH